MPGEGGDSGGHSGLSLWIDRSMFFGLLAGAGWVAMGIIKKPKNPLKKSMLMMFAPAGSGVGGTRKTDQRQDENSRPS